MNKPEFDKLIVELRKLAKFGRHRYAMQLFDAYPCDRKAVLATYYFLDKQLPECEDLEIDVCCN